MSSIVFKCGICGKEHSALPPLAPDFIPEEVAKRRQAWIEADDKLSKYPGNEHYENDYFKTWFAYGATMSNGVLRIPNTITTSKKAGEFLFKCADHEEKEEHHPKKQCCYGNDYGGDGEKASIPRPACEAF